MVAASGQLIGGMHADQAVEMVRMQQRCVGHSAQAEADVADPVTGPGLLQVQSAVATGLLFAASCR